MSNKRILRHDDLKEAQLLPAGSTLLYKTWHRNPASSIHTEVLRITIARLGFFLRKLTYHKPVAVLEVKFVS